MSGIRGKDTKPELAVRSFLHRQGFRFRLHKGDLPGKPDLFLRRYRLAIFVHGCFWHRHQGCFYTTNPASRQQFWSEKFEANQRRDLLNREQLLKEGWRVLTIWECGLKHRADRLCEITEFIKGPDKSGEWPETPPRVRSAQTESRAPKAPSHSD
ncbi:very short patch repair endonuclease [Marinobacter sp. NFXS9]|uniref:very short patch repair endonuclease n=1 Tax=Marinobacter sp. NFXS9 TaxID=2818433 RepID=UPI0032DEFF3F